MKPEDKGRFLAGIFITIAIVILAFIPLILEKTLGP